MRSGGWAVIGYMDTIWMHKAVSEELQCRSCGCHSPQTRRACPHFAVMITGQRFFRFSDSTTSSHLRAKLHLQPASNQFASTWTPAANLGLHSSRIIPQRLPIICSACTRCARTPPCHAMKGMRPLASCHPEKVWHLAVARTLDSSHGRGNTDKPHAYRSGDHEYKPYMSVHACPL